MFKKDRDAITALSRELSGLKHDIGMNLVDVQAVEDLVGRLDKKFSLW